MELMINDEKQVYDATSFKAPSKFQQAKRWFDTQVEIRRCNKDLSLLSAQFTNLKNCKIQRGDPRYGVISRNFDTTMVCLANLREIDIFALTIEHPEADEIRLYAEAETKSEKNVIKVLLLSFFGLTLISGLAAYTHNVYVWLSVHPH